MSKFVNLQFADPIFFAVSPIPHNKRFLFTNKGLKYLASNLYKKFNWTSLWPNFIVKGANFWKEVFQRRFPIVKNLRICKVRIG
jgi:hypothetical protein